MQEIKKNPESNPPAPENPALPVLDGVWATEDGSKKILFSTENTFKLGSLSDDKSEVAYLKGIYSQTKTELTLTGKLVSTDNSNWTNPASNANFILPYSVAETELTITFESKPEVFKKSSETDVTINIPDNPDTQKEPVLYGNWRYTDNASYIADYYFDKNGTFYIVSTTLPANHTYSKGVYKIISETEMTQTIEFVCNQKKAFSVLAQLNSEDPVYSADNFVWSPYSSLYNASPATVELTYSLSNEKLTFTFNNTLIELSRYSIQTVDLTGKRLVSTNMNNTYTFQEGGKYTQLINGNNGVYIINGDYVFNTVNNTLLTKPASVKLPDGSVITEKTSEYGKTYLQDMYIDYFIDKDLYVLFYSSSGSTNAITFRMIEKDAPSYNFSDKLYETEAGDKFFSTGNIVSLYLKSLDFSDCYTLDVNGNSFKLTYSYSTPYTYDGFYFDYLETDSDSIKITSKIGPGQTLQELYTAYGVTSFVCPNDGNGNQITILPLIHAVQIGSDPTLCSITIKDGKINIPVIEFSGTYTEHFDAETPYFEAGGLTFYYVPLTLDFKKAEN